MVVNTAMVSRTGAPALPRCRCQRTSGPSGPGNNRRFRLPIAPTTMRCYAHYNNSQHWKPRRNNKINPPWLKRPWRPETTPQPENNDKKKAGTKTSLRSARSLSPQIAAGIGLHGLNKQQATRQNATTSELASWPAALQKAQENQKSELEGYQTAGRPAKRSQTPAGDAGQTVG